VAIDYFGLDAGIGAGGVKVSVLEKAEHRGPTSDDVALVQSETVDWR